MLIHTLFGNVRRAIESFNEERTTVRVGQRARFSDCEIKGGVLANVSTLAYFDVNAKTQVIADASPVGLGAVLVQKQGEDYKIICYASRSLSDIERRYSQTEKEALGLVWVVRCFTYFCSLKHLSYL